MKNQTLLSINPYTQKIIGKHRIDSDKVILQKINKAHQASHEWRQLSIAQRAQYLQKLAKALLTNKHSLAEMAALEMGKPITQGIAEVEKCAKSIQYYTKHGKNILADLTIDTDHSKSYVTYQALGVVLAIMPWNFPFWQVYRALGAIMISGNTMVLKHASQVTGCAMMMKEIWDNAGLPPDIFQVLKISGSKMDAIISHPFISAVTFTGSTSAGKKVAAIAASNLKKQVLELGGSDAYIICEDADLDLAAEKLVQSRMNNAGQSCISAKRIIVTKKNASALISKLHTQLLKYELGDPLDKRTLLGVMSRQELRDELHAQVQKSIAKGAKLLCGGIIPEGNHAAYPATLLTHVKKGMPAYEEELFGPVVVVIVVSDEATAIKVANDTTYGLGGGIFSKNIKKANELAKNVMQSGAVVINTFLSSNPRMPFGGIKESGYGRELASFGVHEFCNIKSISID